MSNIGTRKNSIKLSSYSGHFSGKSSSNRAQNALSLARIPEPEKLKKFVTIHNKVLHKITSTKASLRKLFEILVKLIFYLDHVHG